MVDAYFGSVSVKIRMLAFMRSQLMIGSVGQEVVICANILKCLCSPTFPPSGVSTGSIKHHCEECSSLGPITFALASNGRFIFLRCETIAL